MGNSQGSGNPADSFQTSSEVQSPLAPADDFERRWKVFLQSLDISSGHVKHVESLDKQKKLELLLSFESKNPLCNVAKSINLLKNLDWSQILGNNKKKDSGSTLRSLLSTTEISLRTNSVDWVYEFLQCDGLEVLSDFMAICLELLSRNSLGQACNSLHAHRSNQEWHVPPLFPLFEYDAHVASENVDAHSRHELRRSIPSSGGNPISGSSRQPVPDSIKELLKDCLHLCLRCLKTILNNQTGCKRAFEYPLVLRVITFCLLHPSFMTKALALDLLTALCLIEGGHIKVLQAFDHFRLVMGEGLRFEMLLDSFKHHDTLDVEHYNIDFAIACVQFFNIVVHSPENINLRVYLQYELYLLGLDDVLQKLKDRAGDRLVQHIEAYLDNRVDCSLLLEDAEAKESAVSKLERLEAELSSKISASREAARLEVESAFKARELELSELVESLRSRIRDLNIASWDRENIMKRRVEELQHALHASRSEVMRLQAALDSVKTSAVSEKVFASMATSTHFDVDANASVTNSNVIYETPHAIRKEPGRSASMDTESQSVQAAGSVDRAVRNRHEKHMAICTPLEKIKIGSDDRKLSSFKVCSSGPQKPVRKQNKFDSVDNPEEHPGCPNNTVIRRLAADAATTLSQLVNSTSVQGGNFGSHCLVPTPPYSIVPPSAWPYNPHSTIPVCDTLFGSDALQKSISIHPNNMDLPSTNSSNLDEIWSRNWNNLSELWLSAVKYNDSVFSTAVNDSAPSSDQTSFSFQWLVDLQLLPSNVNEVYSAQDQSIQETISLHHWKLYRLLVRYAVPCLPAQRMLWQLRNEVHTHHSSGLQSYSWLLDKIEMSLTQQFGSTRQSDWRFHAAPENRWFWTSALLRISLIWQLFPMELQRVTEGLSTLLAGCTAILVNSKLPTVLQLAILFAQRVVADWTSDSFDLRHLDALVDWNLPSSASPAMNLHPPMNGGPPAYHSAPGDNTHPASEHRSNSLVPGSFMTAFVQLVSQVAPSMMDWPADLGHVEPVLRVSIEDILMRIQDTKTALDVWRVIAPISSDLDTELEYVTHNHIQSVLQDTDQQIFRLVQSAEATRTVVKSTAYWLRISSSTVPSSRTDWLAPLVRFAAAFRRCAADMAKKRRNALAGIDNTSISNSPHRHEHRRGKNEKSHASHNDDKSEHRRRKHRTRQLDSDGIMDDILAGLTYQPLRTDIHTKRKESNGHKASS